MKKDFLVVLGFMFLAAIMISCSSSDTKTGSGNSTVADFTTTDIEGNSHSISEFIGRKPVIINFWGTWCPPCKREMPDLKRIYDEYKGRGLEIVGLAVNDTPEKVKAFAGQYGTDWMMLMSTKEAMLAFGLGSAIPVTIFYDKDGKEQGRYTGARGYEDFKIMVEKMI
nr:TlpA family protein disulfide reductase [candidate division Zixibacteria bacterium]